MFLNHEAIAKAYPNEKLVITDTESGTVVTDHSSKAFTINQSLVDAAQAEIDKLKYKTDRTTNGSTIYASFGDQLDMLYADMVAGKLDTTGTWATHIKAVKDANPKP